ncbi:hypothetical protein AS593_12010 [Caulobacter vibrioides]|nr:hypothetical protein AS593_12010 [Caulobacter vibrioides]
MITLMAILVVDLSSYGYSPEVINERGEKNCNTFYRTIERLGGFDNLSPAERNRYAGYSWLCPLFDDLLRKESAKSAKAPVVPVKTRYKEPPLKSIREASAKVKPVIHPPVDAGAPPPSNPVTPSVETRDDDVALCEGAGVGWIEVTKSDVGVFYAGGPPTASSTAPGVVPQLRDRLTFASPVTTQVFRSQIPCLLSSDMGCESEQMSGEFQVAGRVMFAHDVGGRDRWQLCVTRRN